MNKQDILFLKKYSWVKVIKVLILLMLIYALAGFLIVSHPFAFYNVRASTLNYSRIFFLHGLTVGFAGITGLLVSQSFKLSDTIKQICLYATIIAVLIGITGGAINRSQEVKFNLWYQILSMFALDVILVSLVVGFIIVFIKQNNVKRQLSYWLGFLASISAMIAAFFGDLVGYIMDFGNHPAILGWYAHAVGYTLAEWQDNLLRTHSDMIVVSVLCLLIAIANYKYGRKLTGTAAKVQKCGEVLIIIGILLMLAIYLISGLGGSGVQIPHIFTEKGFFEPRGHSVAGIDLGDFTIGVFIFVGGILTTGAAAFGKRLTASSISQKALTTIRGIFIAILCILLAVGGLGFLEEYRADLYNSDVLSTPLGNFGFIFRLLHVDICLLLFPALILLMLLGEVSLEEKNNLILQRILRLGIIVTFIGALIFMLFNYQKFGPGTWVLAAGIVVVVVGIIYYLFKADASKAAE